MAMKIKVSIFTAAAAAVIFFPQSGSASGKVSPIILMSGSAEYRTGLHLHILEDKTGKLSFDEILKPETAAGFKPSRSEAPNPGFIDTAVWVKFSIKNPGSAPAVLYLEHQFPPMDIIDLYYPAPGGFVHKRAGDSVPYEDRDLIYRNAVFRLDVPAGGQETYYMRFESSSSMNLDMTIRPAADFLEKIDTEQYFLGIYYGIMFVMALFNFFVFLSIREKTYLYYVAFIIFYSIFQLSLNGLGYKFLSGYALKVFNNSIPAFMVITTSAGLLFTRYFLNSAATTPLYDRYMKALLAANIACIFLSLTAGYSKSIQAATLLISLTIVSMTINGFLCLFKGYRSARYYAVGWAAFLAGGLLQTSKAFGLVEVNFFTVWSQQIGSAMVVTFLSLALTDRLNLSEKEKSEAREKLLEVQEAYSAELENEVYKKTVELQEERNLLKEKNLQMNKEIALAKKIQKQIIPANVPVAYIASLYKPMDEVGGDYFDFIKFDDPEKIGIFLSDVTGHGVPAAFITSMVKTIILQADERKHDPAALMNHINDLLLDHTAGNFVTAFYCIYDAAERSIYFSNAGHTPPYLINKNSVQNIESTSGIPLGIMSRADMTSMKKIYTGNKLFLEPGSKLLLYTDGLTEARTSDGQSVLFEYAGLRELLIKHSSLECAAFIQEIYSGLKIHTGGELFEDDICMICVDIA
jgi:serine phosphatase RsbU (regulator of sigma subunit)